jgi:hypothetical protein
MTLDDLSDDMERSGFWDWFMRWFVRILRLFSKMKTEGEDNEA